MTYSVWNCQQFFDKLDFSLKIYQYVAYRPPYTSILLAILRQELDIEQIVSYGDSADLYDQYRTWFAQNEANLMFNVHNIYTYYPSLYEYWNTLDSIEGCSKVYSNNTIRTSNLCLLCFNFIMRDGFSNAIYGIIGFNDDQHYKTRIRFGSDQYQTFKSDMLQSEMLVNLTDAPAFYLYDLLGAMTDQVKLSSVVFFDEMALISYTKFGIALIYLVIVYLLYMEITLYQLNLFIWKIKHLLGLIPIEVMIEKVDEIRQLINELS